MDVWTDGRSMAERGPNQMLLDRITDTPHLLFRCVVRDESSWDAQRRKPRFRMGHPLVQAQKWNDPGKARLLLHWAAGPAKE